MINNYYYQLINNNNNIININQILSIIINNVNLLVLIPAQKLPSNHHPLDGTAIIRIKKNCLILKILVVHGCCKERIKELFFTKDLV